jgi:hypothetical protein
MACSMQRLCREFLPHVNLCRQRCSQSSSVPIFHRFLSILYYICKYMYRIFLTEATSDLKNMKCIRSCGMKGMQFFGWLRLIHVLRYHCIKQKKSEIIPDYSCTSSFKIAYTENNPLQQRIYCPGVSIATDRFGVQKIDGHTHLFYYSTKV